MAVIKLFESNKKTDLLLYPKPKDVLADLTGTKGKLLPFLSFDAGIVQQQWAGTRLHYILADVSVPPLHFLRQDGKWALQEAIKGLRPITDLSEIDATPAYLTTTPDFDEKLQLEKTLEYNAAGELVSEVDANGLRKRSYRWQEVGGKRLPVQMDETFLLGNQPRTDSVLVKFDADGFPSHLTYERPAIAFEYTETYELKKNKKGETIVTTPQRKDWKLIVTENEQSFFVEEDGVRRGYGKANTLAAVIREYARTALRNIANALAYEAFKTFTFDMEANAEGIPVSMTARYQSEAKTKSFVVTRKQVGDVVKVQRNGEDWAEHCPARR